MIHLGETLPAKLDGEAREIRWGTLLLLIGVLFPCSLVSFGIGAPTGVVMAAVKAGCYPYTMLQLDVPVFGRPLHFVH